MFRPADRNRRLPAYLQPHTKENIIWQLQLTALIILGGMVWDEYQSRQYRKRHSY